MKLELNSIFFRFAELSDAKFILQLRTDSVYNQYLSEVKDDLNEQIKWLKKYKEREKEGREYYFIICLKEDNLPIGTVRIYDLKISPNSFCWGSWILNYNKTRYAALESALLIYDFAFDQLGFDQCHMDIRKDNLKVIDFHKRFGVEIVGETDLDLLGVYKKENFKAIRNSIFSVVNNEINTKK